MPLYGPNYASSASMLGSGEDPWVTPSEGLVEDGNVTWADMDSGNPFTTDVIQFADFGFSIPSDERPVTLILEMKVRNSFRGVGFRETYEGTIFIEEDLAFFPGSGVPWPDTLTWRTLTFNIEGLTPAEINDITFGIAFACWATADNTMPESGLAGRAEIDVIRVSINTSTHEETSSKHRRRRHVTVPIKANESTAARRRVYFQCYDAADSVTPETGEAGGQPQISTNGAAFTDTGIGTLNAIGNGRYYADLTQAAVATAGDSIETRYKSANTTETEGQSVRVVAYDPYDAGRLGLTSLPNAIPAANGGLPTVNASNYIAGVVGTLNDFDELLAAITFPSIPTASQIADAVCEEQLAPHSQSGNLAWYIIQQANINVEAIAEQVLGRGMVHVEANADPFSLCALVLAGLNATIGSSTLVANKVSDGTAFQTFAITTDVDGLPIRAIGAA